MSEKWNKFTIVFCRDKAVLSRINIRAGGVFYLFLLFVVLHFYLFLLFVVLHLNDSSDSGVRTCIKVRVRPGQTPPSRWPVGITFTRLGSQLGYVSFL